MPEQRPIWHAKVIGNLRRPCIVTDHQEQLRAILEDPNYDQADLQAWFRRVYGDAWRVMWNQYLETGQF